MKGCTCCEYSKRKDLKLQKNLHLDCLIKFKYMIITVKSLANNICNTKIKVNLKTIDDMQDKDFTPCYFFTYRTTKFVCLLSILIFMTLFTTLHLTQISAQKTGENFSTYTDNKNHFEIEYPASWEKREYPAAENSSIIEFLGPATGAEPRTPSVNIFIFPSGNHSIRQAITEVVSDLGGIPVNSSTVLNDTAHVLAYKVSTAHQEFQKLQLWVGKPERTYVITYTDLPKSFSVHLPQIVKMITTLKIA